MGSTYVSCDVVKENLKCNSVIVCGSTEKKRELRYYMERSPTQCDLSADTVPDTNVLTSVLKDFLRELPAPLVPTGVYRMLVDANAVRLPNDRQANARLVFGIIDCLPRIYRVGEGI